MGERANPSGPGSFSGFNGRMGLRAGLLIGWMADCPNPGKAPFGRGCRPHPTTHEARSLREWAAPHVPPTAMPPPLLRQETGFTGLDPRDQDPEQAIARCCPSTNPSLPSGRARGPHNGETPMAMGEPQMNPSGSGGWIQDHRPHGSSGRLPTVPASWGRAAACRRWWGVSST
jgi:hypothetical protein